MKVENWVFNDEIVLIIKKEFKWITEIKVELFWLRYSIWQAMNKVILGNSHIISLQTWWWGSFIPHKWYVKVEETARQLWQVKVSCQVFVNFPLWPHVGHFHPYSPFPLYIGILQPLCSSCTDLFDILVDSTATYRPRSTLDEPQMAPKDGVAF